MRDKIINSMLWAAYGDSLGFIGELCDAIGLQYRIGTKEITGLTEWRRKIGGRYGVSVNLPSGCYSDDTQLRLAVCRSIGNGGIFDFEVFSKIEVPVFIAYGLGAGRGTKTAAESLKKKTIQWNTNFFETRYSRYIDGGGNGAAMRIQPHVWAAPEHLSNSVLIREIIRDVIITHGSPVAWVPSVFYGLVLRETLEMGSLPDPDKWEQILVACEEIIDVCLEDPLLKDIWVPHWEKISGGSLENAVMGAIDDMRIDMSHIRASLFGKNSGSLSTSDLSSKYRSLVQLIDGFNPKIRGSGIKTVLLAMALTNLFSEQPEAGLLVAANTLGSDTDTISTIAGALLGLICATPPPSKVLDEAYLIVEAERLDDIRSGNSVSHFNYPSLLTWNCPKSSIDCLGILAEAHYALCGLGKLTRVNDQVYITKQSNTEIQRAFFTTSFGQTLLLSFRTDPKPISADQLPTSDVAFKQKLKSETVASNGKTTDLFSLTDNNYKKDAACTPTIDEITNKLIKNRFDEKDIGHALLNYAEFEDGIEKAIAFASIIVKAKKARLKKGRLQRD